MRDSKKETNNLFQTNTVENQTENTSMPVSGSRSNVATAVFDIPNQVPATSVNPVSSTPASLGSSQPATTPTPKPSRPRGGRLPWTIKVGIILFILVLIGGVTLLIRATMHNGALLSAQNTDVAQRFSPLNIPLSELANTGVFVDSSRTLSINGQLKVNNGFVVTPTAKPTTAVAGQIYYDQDTNQLNFFNGTGFAPLLTDKAIVTSVTSLGGANGALALGNGLVRNGSQVSNSGLLSLQGQTGNVTLTAGPGIAINGTTLSTTGVLSFGGQNGAITLGSGLTLTNNQVKNSGVLSVASTSSTLTVTSDGNGNITLANNNVGNGTVQSPGGTTGHLAVFTGVQTIADSLISQSGSVVSVNGDLTLSGTSPETINLTNTTAGVTGQIYNDGNLHITGGQNNLWLDAGGSGTIFINAGNTNPVAVHESTIPLYAFEVNGDVNVTTGHTYRINGVPFSSSVVSSLDGLNGALSVANSTGSGSTVTINNAAADGATKGIAAFNSTNFTASTGVINTIQNIATTSSPTFGQLTLTSSQASANMLVANNTNASATGNLIDIQLNGSSKFNVAPSGNTTIAGSLAVNTITPSSTLVIGATNQGFTLQGNNFSTISATNGSFATTLGFTGTPVGNVNYKLDQSVVAGTYTICSTIGNCAGSGGGVTTSGGSTNTIPKFLSGQSIGNSGLTDDGTNISTIEHIIQNFNTISGTGTTHSVTDSSNSGASAVQGVAINLTGTNTTGTNTVTGITFGNVAAATNNTYNGISFGTGLTSLLTYNGSPLVSGTGLLQNVALDSTQTYGNLQKVGALSVGSIASGFGVISTTNNISTTAAIQGGTGVFTGTGTLTLGTASTSTGSIIFKGSGGTGTLTLQGPTTPNVGNFALTIPAITGNANICTDNAVCAGYAPSTGSGSYIQNTTTVQTNANFAIQSVSDASITAYIKERATQSADTFHIDDSNGNYILKVDTFGTLHAANAATFDKNIGVGMSSSSGEQLRIAAASTSTIGLSVYGNSGQTANLFQINAGGAASPAFTITGTGATTIQNSANSTAAFQVQTASSAAVLTADTTNGRVGVGAVAPTATLDILQPNATSGSPLAFRVTGGTHTTLADANSPDAQFNFGRSVQFVGSSTNGAANFTNQHAIELQSPGYSFSGTGNQVIANAVGFYVNNPPTANAANTTLTNSIGLLIDNATNLNQGGTVTNSYGLYVNQPGSSGNNYGAYISSELVVGTNKTPPAHQLVYLQQDPESNTNAQILHLSANQYTTVPVSDNPDVVFDLNHNIQFLGSSTNGAANLSTTNGFEIKAPNYSYSNTGNQVIANAATEYINSGPTSTAGNTTLTNSYGLMVDNASSGGGAVNAYGLRVVRPSYATNNYAAYFDSGVGIGTATPQNALDAGGSVAIGASYAGVNAAPSNGLIVQGSVGIGTNNPGTAALNVTGTINDLVKLNTTQNTGFVRVLEGEDASLGAGNNITLHAGHDIGTNYNSAYFGLNYQGSASTSNAVTLGLYGADNLFNIQANGKVGIGTLSPSADLSFNAGAARKINVNQEASSTAGDNLSIVAGQSGSGAVNGGNLVLQAGATGGSGTTGSVIVQANGSNSTTALQVQNAAGNVVLSADTTNAQVTLGNITTTLAQAVTGKLLFADGTADGFGATIQAAGAFTGNVNFQLPNGYTGNQVVCISGNNCSYAPISGSNNYVQLQATTPGTAQTGNLNISGTAIVGTLQTNGHGSFGSGAAPSASTILSLDETINPTTNTNGVSDILRLNPTGADANYHSGFNGQAQTKSGNAQNFTGGLRGVTGFGQHNGTGTLNQAWGGDFYLQNTSTGTVTDARGVEIGSATNSGGGTITTNYGLRVDDQTVGATNWGIYTGLGANRFGDATKVNATSTTAFQVQNAGGGATILKVDTTNSSVGVNGASTTAGYALNTTGSINASTSVLSPVFDTATNTGLAIGSANATGIAIGNSGINNLTTIYGATLVKASINAANTFAVQNATGGVLFNVDTSGSNVTVGTSGAGTATLQGNVVTITAGAASTWSTTAGSLTVQGAGGTTINTPNSTTANTSAITIQSGNASTGSNLSAGNVVIDTGTDTGTGTSIIQIGKNNATDIQIGQNGSPNPHIKIDSGTGTIDIGSGANARTVNLGTGTAAQNVNVGSSSSTGTTNIQGGTGGINIGTGNVANTIKIGTTSNAVSQTINLGNNGTASSTDTINIGSLIGTSATTVQGGTSGTAISLTTGSGGGIGITTAGAGQIKLTPGSSQVLIQPTTDSTTAFQVQNAAGTTNVLSVDTTNQTTTFNSGVGNPLSLNVTSAALEDGLLFKSTGINSGEIGIAGGAGQIINQTAANDLAIKSISGRIFFSAGGSVSQLTLSTTGQLTAENSTNSSTAFQVENASATSALAVSTNNVATGANAANSTLVVAKDSGTSRSINAAGTINASGADYAEYFTQVTPGSLQKGDLTCLTPTGQAEACSTGKTSDLLVGAVSSNPGYVGNDIFDPAHPDNTALVGLLGQIEVKVSTANGPVHAGDMLAMSSTPGVAVKATTPGMALGSALQDYTSAGSGQINVYVHVGYYAPSDASLQQNNTNSQYVQNGSSAAFSSLNVSGTTTLSDLKVTGSATIASLTVTNNLITAALTVNGHIMTGGGAPTITAGLATCVSPTATISGTDTAGLITVTTNSGCTNSGDIAKITFNQAFTAAPRVTLTPANANSASLKTYVNSDTITPASFTIATPTSTINGSTIYKWFYQVIQ